MAKQNPDVTYQLCFPEKYVEGWICQWFEFSSPTYSSYTIKYCFFIKVFIL